MLLSLEKYQKEMYPDVLPALVRKQKVLEISEDFLYKIFQELFLKEKWFNV